MLAREAAERVLAGHGLITIVRDWNRRGVPSPLGRAWKAPTLRKALLASRMAGLREHAVDPSGKTLGELSPAVWDGALDRQTWDQLRAVLLNPERSTNVRTPWKYLLTGLIQCGGCGAAMISRPKDHNTKRYLCAGRRKGHQLAIVAAPVDDLVAEHVLELLARPSFREALVAGIEETDDGSAKSALADLGNAQLRLQRLDDDYYVRGLLAEGRYRSIRTKLEHEIDRLHVLADAATKQRIVLHPDPRAFWAEADFQQRRELVRLVVERVIVTPGRPGVGRFDPARVQIETCSFGSSSPTARHTRSGLSNAKSAEDDSTNHP